MRIRAKILLGFAVVIAIFALASLIVRLDLKEVAGESRRFAEEHSPTADMSMETSIAVGIIVARVMNPASESEAEKLIASARENS